MVRHCGMRGVAGIGVIPFLPLLGGCYTYQEATFAEVQPRDHVSVQIQQEAYDRVRSEATGMFPRNYFSRSVRDGSRLLRGQVEWVEGETMHLSLPGAGLARLDTEIRATDVEALRRSELHHARTAGFVLGAAGLGYLLYQGIDAVFGGGGEQPRPGPGPEFSRAPLVSIPIF